MPQRSNRIARLVRLRDGDICQCCGNGDGAEVHHIHPLFLGGEDTPDNAICLCELCHKYSPDDPERFLAYQRRGGAYLQFLQETVTYAHSKQSETLARENLTEASKNHDLIDLVRATAWGWTTGRNVIMRWLQAGELSPEQAIKESRERIAQANKHLNWRLSLAGRSARSLDQDVSELVASLKDSPLPAGQLAAEYDCAFEDIAEAFELQQQEVAG